MFLTSAGGMLINNAGFGGPLKSELENQSGKGLKNWEFKMFLLCSYAYYFKNNYSRALVVVLSRKEHLLCSQ